MAAFVLGAIDGLLAAMDPEPDPLDLARPSVERLEFEAKHAAENSTNGLERGRAVDRLLASIALVLALVLAFGIVEATRPLIVPLVALLVMLALVRAVWPSRRSGR